MKKKWTIGDVVDLECLLNQDSRIEDEKILEQRDRRIYLEKIAPLVSGNNDKKNGANPMHPTLVRLWLFFMGQACGILPGVVVDAGFRLLRGMLLVGGVVTGLVVCLSLFSYTGKLPLNVSYFFGVILLPQTLLLFFTLAGLLLMKIRPDQGPGFGIYPALGFFAAQAAAWFFHKTLGRLSGEKQAALKSALGSFQRSRHAHGHLFVWPLFVLMQLFGVGFNLGVLGATLGRVAFFDTAFGWQSTLNLSHDFVHRVVSMVALPWSWAFPGGVGFPTAEQIQGTRLILKDGIYPLATTDLVSWWPFLCLTVVVYALAPRILLLFLGSVAQERGLSRYPLDGWAVQKLVNRMVSPRVTTEPVAPGERSFSPAKQSGPGVTTGPPASWKAKAPSDSGASEDGARQQPGDGLIQEPRDLEMPVPFLALVHDDIFDLYNTDEFRNRVQLRLNRRVDTILRVGVDVAAEMDAIITSSGSTAGIVMLQEAWMPPIREILKFISTVRTNTGKIPLVVVLVGKPGSDTLFTVPDQQDKKIWAMKLNGLGDPLIHLEALVQS